MVGGGYTGLSTALHLAERGYDVVVLEAEKVGWGASGRNGGQIVTAYNPSMGTVAGWVGKDDARLLWELGEESKAILRDRVARHRIDCDLRWGYVMAALKQRQMAGLRDMEAEWRNDYGYGEALPAGPVGDPVHGRVRRLCRRVVRRRQRRSFTR